MVYPVWINKWEPELISIHSTKQGAEGVVTHLRSDECDCEDCFHDEHAWVGTALEIKP